LKQQLKHGLMVNFGYLGSRPIRSHRICNCTETFDLSHQI
jgi:hypothetical protein